MLSESLGEGFDDGVATHGSQGGHVENGADGFASSADAAFAFVGSAVAVEGGHSDERGDFLPVELSQFGDVGDHGGGSDAAEPIDGFDELSLVAPIVVGLDEILDGGFDAVDLPLQGFEDSLDAFPGRLGRGDSQPIGFLGSQIDELPSAGDELLDFDLFLGSFLDRRRLYLLCEEGQDAGINAIGLGHQAQGPGEVASPLGIDDGDSKAGVGEVGDNFSFVAAGGFEDDETIGWTGEQLTELLMSGWRVGEGVGLPSGEEVEIERGFGDVDSDPNLVRAIHGGIPFLSMRARASLGGATAQATVRVNFQRPAAIQLCDGVFST
jgi:hypothetical protein